MSNSGQHDGPFLGRSDELRQLVRNIHQGRHTLLVGPTGIGKTRLLLEAVEVISGRRRRIELAPSVFSRLSRHLVPPNASSRLTIITIKHASPLGDCLREFCEELHKLGNLALDPPVPSTGSWSDVRKRLIGLGTIKLQQLVIHSIQESGKKYLIILDSLDRIGPTHKSLLEHLLESATVCAGVVQMNQANHFRKVWSSFDRIELKALPSPVAELLVRYHMHAFSVHCSDPRLYMRQVLKAANGNPFHLRNLVWQGSRQRRVGLPEVHRLRQVEQGDYFNMGPIYIFGASVFTLFKIFSLGTSNREFYIYFSALGFIVYLTFRVFRTFFLFRPQKYKS